MINYPIKFLLVIFVIFFNSFSLQSSYKESLIIEDADKYAITTSTDILKYDSDKEVYHLDSEQNKVVFPLNLHNKIQPEDINQSFYAGQVRNRDPDEFVGSGFLLSVELQGDQIRVTGISALHNFVQYNNRSSQFNFYKKRTFTQGSISESSSCIKYSFVEIDEVWATEDCSKDICLFKGNITEINNDIWKTNQLYLETFNLKNPVNKIVEIEIKDEKINARMWHFICTDEYQRLSKGKLNGIKGIHKISTLSGSSGGAIFIDKDCYKDISIDRDLIGIHTGTPKAAISPNKIVIVDGFKQTMSIADYNSFEKFSLVDLNNLETGINIFTKKRTWPKGFKLKVINCLNK